MPNPPKQPWLAHGRISRWSALVAERSLLLAQLLPLKLGSPIAEREPVQRTPTLAPSKFFGASDIVSPKLWQVLFLPAFVWQQNKCRPSIQGSTRLTWKLGVFNRCTARHCSFAGRESIADPSTYAHVPDKGFECLQKITQNDLVQHSVRRCSQVEQHIKGVDSKSSVLSRIENHPPQMVVSMTLMGTLRRTSTSQNMKVDL